MAEGVLPICLGFATRFAGYLAAGVKEYTADFLLGKSYNTFDITGTPMAQSGVKPTYSRIEEILNSFVGERPFIVPAFSAKKIDGKRAYALAREGKLEDAGAAVMRIYSVKLLKYQYPAGSFSVTCAKGTYVRSLINALGKESGAEAAMSGLVRTRSGEFTLESVHRFADLEKLKEEGRLRDAVIAVDSALPFKKGVVSDLERAKIVHGAVPKGYIDLPQLSRDEEYLIMDEGGNILALAINSAPYARLKKVFAK
jgi:tRNA pseudouridine55 synthase